MGTQDKTPNANNSMQRVKVYRLNEDGKWDDQGTGHVTVDYLERSEDLGLFVIDEEDNETLLLHRISSQDIYRKQEDTVISWRDPEFSTELALSFQEMTGCSYIWDHLCSVQRNIQFSSLSNETYHNVNNELRELPPVELSTLPLILKIVVESGIAGQLRANELILHYQDFFPKLVDLFRICEDLENTDGLHMIFKLVRGIILLNSPQIFEKIFGDELIMDIIGCLEFDPDVPHVHHRSFLKEHVVFKEAMPIKDPLVLSKIHQTYRIGYLKDVILPRALDEATIASLNSIIHSNNATVVSLLKDDSTFIQELFARLKCPTTSADSKKTLVHFLHEFCTLSKSLQMVQQLRLFRDLVSEGIFDIIADVLQSDDKKLVLTGTDILILFLNQDPTILRSYVTRQEGVLFGLLVKNMLTDFGDDMHCQFLEILRSLLDSYTSASQRESIVEIFYEKHLGQLIDAITSSCQPNDAAQTSSKFVSSGGGNGNQRGVRPEILLSICDLLCFCVLHHPYRIKCDFLLNNVIDKVLYLTRRREKYLVVAAVRFVRTLISRSDEHLMDHIVKNNLFKPIVDAFVANGDRYNLLNSAVLELFEFIRKENLKILLRYIVDSFWDQLVKLENLSSIQALKVKYEQSLESTGMRSTASLLDQRKRIDERALEREEEDYFNEDSDEENSASAASTNRVQSQPVLANGSALNYPSLRASGLVDYEDDEDDEDYRPPPKKLSDISDEDEGLAEFRLKRKSVSKEEPEPKRLLQSPKGPKPREGVFAALCSTLSQAVLPSKKTTGAGTDSPQLDARKTTIEPAYNVKGSMRSSDDNGNADMESHSKDEEASPRSFSDSLHDYPENGQRGDDCSLLPPKSSPEMAVNGS
ncbi:serine threonine- phosphatase 4 regulatory subunit 3 isoform X1 [Olea europaea subsp. europaea]|uniref:Serine threonine- phosphatase 4 regulatory subunit 3 isoform X1 n=1 Tax=Olea europaea subsp. europaea TaxID=158383 RepID=A0A8S0PER9_OLEEU|nr:serine threonine- phosphatase 4 regulatory subunit 3 isoform X1 [Olea europaea subsp. europaea]